MLATCTKQNLNATTHAALITIVSVMAKNRKTYAFPSQEKILELLEKFHGIRIQRRALNYALSTLEKLGYIRRKRRIARDALVGMVFKSTMYFLGFQAEKYLNRMMNASAAVRNVILGLRGKRAQKDPARAKKINSLAGKRHWKTPGEEKMRYMNFLAAEAAAGRG